MAWVRYDDGFARHPKVVRAAKLIGGRFAKSRLLGVHLEATSYCNSHATDGFLADEVVDEELTSDPRARDILRIFARPKIKLAHRVRGGYRLHDYHDYQPSKQEMENSRAYERDRKRRQRACPENVPAGQIGCPGNVPSVSPHPARPARPDQDQDQEQRAAARPVSHPLLVKLAHTVLDDIERGRLPDAEAVAEVKTRAARAKIGYGDHDEVHKAIRSAEGQRIRRRA